ncbi:7934_t:CDS:2, partial [Gigaspora rosea]
MISNQDIKNELSSKIEEDRVIIKDDEGIVEKYDKPGRPPAAISNPDLWDNIHD